MSSRAGTRRHDRPQLAFPITLIVTFAVAMLPVRWQDGWWRDLLEEVVSFPLRPFADAGNRVGGWLRPAPSNIEGVPPECSELVEQLTLDRDLAQRLYQDEHLQVLRLEEENRQLKLIPVETRQVTSRMVTAYVTMRDAGSPLRPVEVQVERGAPADVPPDTIAVCHGVYLLGRTIGAASGGRSSLLSIASRASGPLRARVFPRTDPNLKIEDATLVHLEPTGGGGFSGEIDREVAVSEGDVVRLDDTGWPRTAQMMIVGEIDAIDVSEKEPLRHEIRVRPVFVMPEVVELTLVVEAPRESAPTGGAGP